MPANQVPPAVAGSRKPAPGTGGSVPLPQPGCGPLAAFAPQLFNYSPLNHSGGPGARPLSPWGQPRPNHPPRTHPEARPPLPLKSTWTMSRILLKCWMECGLKQGQGGPLPAPGAGEERPGISAAVIGGFSSAVFLRWYSPVVFPQRNYPGNFRGIPLWGSKGAGISLSVR